MEGNEQRSKMIFVLHGNSHQRSCTIKEEQKNQEKKLGELTRADFFH
jgi:hypothetical protein